MMTANNSTELKPNVLLLVLDATRVDACSCYGNPRATTPVLDRLAAEGVLYEQAIAAAPWTLPAMASIFTGLYPGQLDIYPERRLAPDFETLAALLHQNGYGTFGITKNGWLSGDFGLLRGFETMHKLWQWLQTDDDINAVNLIESASNKGTARVAFQRAWQGNFLKNSLNIAYNRYWPQTDDGAAKICNELTKWVKNQEGPWFAYAHYLEAHLQYRPPRAWVDRFAHDPGRVQRLLAEDQQSLAWRHVAGVDPLSDEDLEALRDLYEAAVAYQDYRMGQIIDWLHAEGELDNTVVIVLADHGENLGEHGLMSHNYCLYDTLLHVPMVVRYPAAFAAGSRVSEQVQTLDLFKTILDLAAVQSPSNIASQSLLQPAARAFTIAELGAPRSPYGTALSRFGLEPDDLAKYQAGLTTIRTDTHKLIVSTDERVELYAWPDDPGETRDLATSSPETVAELTALLAGWWSGHGGDLIGKQATDVAVSAELQARLQALGYID